MRIPKRWISFVVLASLLPGVAIGQGQGKADSTPPRALQTRVWVNLPSRIYHCPGTQNYGDTKDGEFMAEAQARGNGYRASNGRGCNNAVTEGPAPLPDTTAASRQMVWVNTASRVYHCPGSTYWGTTRRGRYLPEDSAKVAGHRASGGKTCTASR